MFLTSGLSCVACHGAAERGARGENVVNRRRYRICWLALAFLAVAQLWLTSSDLQFTYGQFWPSRPEPLTFSIFLLGEVSGLLLLLGLWILFAIKVRGGGRFWWRWWVGGFSAACVISDLASDATTALGPQPVFYLTTAYPWLANVLVILAAPFVWVLARRTRIQ